MPSLPSFGMFFLFLSQSLPVSMLTFLSCTVEAAPYLGRLFTSLLFLKCSFQNITVLLKSPRSSPLCACCNGFSVSCSAGRPQWVTLTSACSSPSIWTQVLQEQHFCRESLSSAKERRQGGAGRPQGPGEGYSLGPVAPALNS